VLEWTGSWESHAKHSVPNFVSTRFFNEQPEAVARIEALIGGETRLQACYVRQNHACLEHDTLDRLAEIRCPTLVCGGGRDPICSPTATAWLGGIPGCETVMFDECSHFFLLEEPERFLQTLLGWLERNTPA
jgi:3-oxoadipate enol-lactonase